MCCVICGQDVRSDEGSVRTSDGATAHVACADREARMAWARRRWLALAHALAVAIVLALLPWVGFEIWPLVLIGIGVILHPLVHRRVWHYLIQDTRRWLRQREQP